jgi:hypothetical protein
MSCPDGLFLCASSVMVSRWLYVLALIRLCCFMSET